MSLKKPKSALRNFKATQRNPNEPQDSNKSQGLSKAVIIAL